jgi:hypothetical protein
MSQSQRLYVVRSGSSATNSTAVSLSAATVKTVVGVLGSSTDTLCLKRVRVSFNSVTSTDAPALVEVGIITAAGTVGTSFTPAQITGSPLASSAAAGYNHSGEPTYTRIIESTYVPVNNGLYEFYYPLGEEPLCAISQGFALRVTAPQAQSCYASLFYSE